MTEIVILGAGYAGLRALHELQKNEKDYHLTLVNRNDYHYETTSLHEVAAGTQSKEKICYPIEEIIDPKRTTFIKGMVTKIDRKNKQVILEAADPITFDYLIVALGFESETFGILGAEENALQMVDIDSAEQVHQHLNARMAAYAKDKQPADLNIVVCGAGFTGVELLGALSEGRPRLAKIAGVEPEEIKLYCVEAVTRLLPMFEEQLAEYGIRHLEKWGVHFLTGKPIKEIKQGSVVYAKDNGKTTEELAASSIIWTTGVSGSRVIAASGFSQKRGRVLVDPDLTAPDEPTIYIVGDVAAALDPAVKRPYPTTAQIALKMGETAAKNILRQLNQEPTKAFVFKSLGTVASIGNTDAFGVVGKAAVKGYPASFIKKAIMDRSLFETGGVKEVLSKGRFDFYH